MYAFIYFVVWSLIGVVLSKVGITYDRLEFWTILLCICGLVMLRVKLYEKDNKEEKSGS